VIVAEAFQTVRADETFEGRFKNWIQWCIRKGLHQGRTGSAEGNWRSPQIWHPPEPRPPVLDDLDAVAVNRAFSQLAQNSPTYANVIKVLVFKPWMRPQAQAQVLGVHYMRLDQELHKAKKMLSNLLRD
jgi:hypothetical protein